MEVRRMDHSPGFLKVAEAARARVKETDAVAVLERLRRGDRFELLDVREDSEWQAGRVPGARHLGRGVLERDIERLIPDPSTEIVLYCGGGYRSALAADSLQQMGYTNVWSLAGGWRGWTESGLPTDEAPVQ
jgi:rhodanese-related sulfurtransferase